MIIETLLLCCLIVATYVPILMALTREPSLEESSIALSIWARPPSHVRRKNGRPRTPHAEDFD